MTIEKPIRTANELGESEITWEPYLDAWASVSPLSAREQLYAKQNQWSITHKVRMRWFRDLQSDHRITWEECDGTERILAINSLFDAEERHVEWQLQCTEQKHVG